MAFTKLTIDGSILKNKMTDLWKSALFHLLLLSLLPSVNGVPTRLLNTNDNMEETDAIQSKPFSDNTIKLESHTILVRDGDNTPNMLSNVQNVFDLEPRDAVSSIGTTHRERRRRGKKSKAALKKKKAERRLRKKGNVKLGVERKSCPTKKSYSIKTKAEDLFGDIVDVYPVIQIGQLALDQYFHESYCDVEHCSCGGINSKQFHSSCETTYSYTYARVVKGGEIGWSYIKVRSGCSCVVQERQ